MTMAAVKDLLTGLEEDLRLEFQHAHVRAQVVQFAGLFASTLLTALATGGFHVAGWGALAGLVVGALGAAARQKWPQVPWPTVLAVLHAGQQAKSASPPKG